MMRNDTFYHNRNGYFNRAKVRQDLSVLDTEPYFKWLSHFERFLRNKAAGKEPLTQDYPEPGPFFLGAQVCYADVAVYDAVMGMWAMDLFDEAAGRARSPLLCELITAVANSPGLKEYEENRGTRRDHYWAAEEAGNRRFAAKKAADAEAKKQAKL